MEDFRAPRWLPGGHAQTIWPALFSRRYLGARPAFRRERWATPDGDFVDVDWQGEDMEATYWKTVHDGRPSKGMPAWKEVFGDDELRNVLVFLQTVQEAADGSN